MATFGAVRKKASTEIRFSDYGKIYNDNDSEDSNRRIINLTDPLDAMCLNKKNDKVVVAGMRGVLQLIKIQKNEDELNEPPSILKDVDLRAFRRGKVNILYSASNVGWNHEFEQYVATTSSNGAIVIWNIVRKNKQVFKSHERSATCLDWCTSNGNYLISGSRDCRIYMYDIRTPGEHQLMFNDGMAEAVRDVKFVKNDSFGDYFFSGDDNGILKMWDIRQNRKWVLRQTAHRSFISTIAMNPTHCSLMATGGGRDKCVRIWKWSKEKIELADTLETMAPLGRCIWNPHSPFQIATCSSVNDINVHVWDIRRKYVPVFSYDEHWDSATDACWPAIGRECFMTCGKDGQVVIHGKDSGFAPLSYACDVPFDITPDGLCGIAVNSEIHYKVQHTMPSLQLAPRPNSSRAAYSRCRPIKKNMEFFKAYDAFHAPIKSFMTFGIPDQARFALPPAAFYILGRDYQLGGRPINRLCSHNAKVAKSVGKDHIYQTWRLVSALCAQAGIQKVYDEEERIYDIQLKKQWEVRKRELANEGRRWVPNLNELNEDNLKRIYADRLESALMINQFFYDPGNDSESPDSDEYLSNDDIEYCDDFWDEEDGLSLLKEDVRKRRKRKERKKRYASQTDFYFGAKESHFRDSTESKESLYLNEFMGLRDEAFELRNFFKNEMKFANTTPGKTTWTPLMEIMRLLQYHAEQGDVQTCASVAIVCGHCLFQVIDTYTVSAWVESYIEMCNRMELFVTSARVKKFCGIASISDRTLEGTDIGLTHSICEKPIINGRCNNCDEFAAPTCTMCRYPVTALCYECRLCRHTMHPEHANEWFSNHNVCCAVGCICECRDSDYPYTRQYFALIRDQPLEKPNMDYLRSFIYYKNATYHKKMPMHPYRIDSVANRLRRRALSKMDVELINKTLVFKSEFTGNNGGIKRADEMIFPTDVEEINEEEEEEMNILETNQGEEKEEVNIGTTLKTRNLKTIAVKVENVPEVVYDSEEVISEGIIPGICEFDNKSDDDSEDSSDVGYIAEDDSDEETDGEYTKTEKLMMEEVDGLVDWDNEEECVKKLNIDGNIQDLIVEKRCRDFVKNIDVENLVDLKGFKNGDGPEEKEYSDGERTMRESCSNKDFLLNDEVVTIGSPDDTSTPIPQDLLNMFQFSVGPAISRSNTPSVMSESLHSIDPLDIGPTHDTEEGTYVEADRIAQTIGEGSVIYEDDEDEGIMEEEMYYEEVKRRRKARKLKRNTKMIEKWHRERDFIIYRVRRNEPLDCLKFQMKYLEDNIQPMEYDFERLLKYRKKVQKYESEFARLYFFIPWKELLKPQNVIYLRIVHELYEGYIKERMKTCERHYQDFARRLVAGVIATRIRDWIFRWVPVRSYQVYREMDFDEVGWRVNFESIKWNDVVGDWMKLRSCLRSMEEPIDFENLFPMERTTRQEWDRQDNKAAMVYWKVFDNVPIRIDDEPLEPPPPIGEDFISIVDSTTAWAKKRRKAHRRTQYLQWKPTILHVSLKKPLTVTEKENERKRKDIDEAFRKYQLKKIYHEKGNVNEPWKMTKLAHEKNISFEDQKDSWPICKFEHNSRIITITPIPPKRIIMFKRRIRKLFSNRFINSHKMQSMLEKMIPRDKTERFCWSKFEDYEGYSEVLRSMGPFRRFASKIWHNQMEPNPYMKVLEFDNSNGTFLYRRVLGSISEAPIGLKERSEWLLDNVLEEEEEPGKTEILLNDILMWRKKKKGLMSKWYRKYSDLPEDYVSDESSSNEENTTKVNSYRRLKSNKEFDYEEYKRCLEDPSIIDEKRFRLLGMVKEETKEGKALPEPKSRRRRRRMSRIEGQMRMKTERRYRLYRETTDSEDFQFSFEEFFGRFLNKGDDFLTIKELENGIPFSSCLTQTMKQMNDMHEVLRKARQTINMDLIAWMGFEYYMSKYRRLMKYRRRKERQQRYQLSYCGIPKNEMQPNSVDRDCSGLKDVVDDVLNVVTHGEDITSIYDKYEDDIDNELSDSNTSSGTNPSTPSDDSSVSSWFTDCDVNICERVAYRDFVDEKRIIVERTRGPLMRKHVLYHAYRQQCRRSDGKSEDGSVDDSWDYEDAYIGNDKGIYEMKREERRSERKKLLLKSKLAVYKYGDSEHVIPINDEVREIICRIHSAEIRRVSNRLLKKMRERDMNNLKLNNYIQNMMPDIEDTKFFIFSILLFDDYYDYDDLIDGMYEAKKGIIPLKRYEELFGKENIYILEKIDDNLLKCYVTWEWICFLFRKFQRGMRSSKEDLREMLRKWIRASGGDFKEFYKLLKNSEENWPLRRFNVNKGKRELIDEEYEKYVIGEVMNDLISGIEIYEFDVNRIIEEASSEKIVSMAENLTYEDWLTWKHVPLCEMLGMKPEIPSSLNSETHNSNLRKLEIFECLRNELHAELSDEDEEPAKECKFHIGSFETDLPMGSQVSQTNEPDVLTTSHIQQLIWDARDVDPNAYRYSEQIMGDDSSESSDHEQEFDAGSESSDYTLKSMGRRGDLKKLEISEKSPIGLVDSGNKAMNFNDVMHEFGIPMEDRKYFKVAKIETADVMVADEDVSDIVKQIEDYDPSLISGDDGGDIVKSEGSQSSESDSDFEDSISYKSMENVTRPQLYFSREMPEWRVPSCILVFSPNEFFKERKDDDLCVFEQYKTMIELTTTEFMLCQFIMRDRLMRDCRRAFREDIEMRYAEKAEQNNKYHAFKECFISVVVDTKMKPWTYLIVYYGDKRTPFSKMEYRRQKMCLESRSEFRAWMECNRVDFNMLKYCPIISCGDEKLCAEHAKGMTGVVVDYEVVEKWHVIRRDEGVRALDTMIKMPPPPESKLSMYSRLFKPIYDEWYEEWKKFQVRCGNSGTFIEPLDEKEKMEYYMLLIKNYAFQYYRMLEIDPVLSKTKYKDFSVRFPTFRSDVPSSALLGRLRDSLVKFINVDSQKLDPNVRYKFNNEVMNIAKRGNPNDRTTYASCRFEEIIEDESTTHLGSLEDVQSAAIAVPVGSGLLLDDCLDEIQRLRNKWIPRDASRKRFLISSLFEISRRLLFKNCPILTNFPQAHEKFEALKKMHMRNRPLLDIMLTRIDNVENMPEDVRTMLYNLKLIDDEEMRHCRELNSQRVENLRMMQQIHKMENRNISIIREESENDISNSNQFLPITDEESASGLEIDGKSASICIADLDGSEIGSSIYDEHEMDSESNRNSYNFKYECGSNRTRDEDETVTEDDIISKRQLAELYSPIAAMDKKEFVRRMKKSGLEYIDRVTDIIRTCCLEAHESWGTLLIDEEKQFVPPVNEFTLEDVHKVKRGMIKYQPPVKWDHLNKSTNGSKWF